MALFAPRPSRQRVIIAKCTDDHKDAQKHRHSERQTRTTGRRTRRTDGEIQTTKTTDEESSSPFDIFVAAFLPVRESHSRCLRRLQFLRAAIGCYSEGHLIDFHAKFSKSTIPFLSSASSCVYSRVSSAVLLLRRHRQHVSTS